MSQRIRPFNYALLAAVAVLLASCAHEETRVSSTATAPPAASQAAAQPAPAPEPEPEEPITEHQASAACWMKYERGRRDLSLEARAKLVDKCIDERMKAAARR
jgi:hypothetical protein